MKDQLRDAYDRSDWGEVERLTEADPGLLPELLTATSGATWGHTNRGEDHTACSDCMTVWGILRRGFEAHPLTDLERTSQVVSLIALGLSPEDHQRFYVETGQTVLSGNGTTLKEYLRDNADKLESGPYAKIIWDRPLGPPISMIDGTQ